jgi:hypothetical protein
MGYNRAMTADGPIFLSTFASLARHGYEMSVHCPRCQRSVEIDLAAFQPEPSYIGRRFRCRNSRPYPPIHTAAGSCPWGRPDAW